MPHPLDHFCRRRAHTTRNRALVIRFPENSEDVSPSRLEGLPISESSISDTVSPDFWSYTRVVLLLNQLCFQESWISCRVCNFIPSSSTVCAFQGPRCGYQRFPPLLVLVHSASVCPAFEVLVITALYAFTASKILDTTSSIVISIAEISSTACSSDPNSLRYKRWC